MRRLFVLCLLLVFSSVVQAQSVEGVNIVDFGLYTVRVGKTVSAPASAFGAEDYLTGVKHLQSKTTISASVGTSFGFRFRVVGKGNGIARLRIVVRFPNPGIRNPKTGEIRQTEAHFDAVKINAVGFSGYAIDEDWEIVPGI